MEAGISRPQGCGSQAEVVGSPSEQRGPQAEASGPQQTRADGIEPRAEAREPLKVSAGNEVVMVDIGGGPPTEHPPNPSTKRSERPAPVPVPTEKGEPSRKRRHTSSTEREGSPARQVAIRRGTTHRIPRSIVVRRTAK